MRVMSLVSDPRGARGFALAFSVGWRSRVEGVLRDPRTAESRLAFPARPARFIRLRQLGAHPDYGWFIAELNV